MLHLVVVRHGEYDPGSGSLTTQGREKVASLAQALAEKFSGLTIALLSSTATRAKETSEILVALLGGIPLEEHGFLYSGENSLGEGQAAQALRLVGEKGATHDVVVLSTHLPFIDDFPMVWGQNNGFKIPRGLGVPKGTARIVNVATGQVDHI